MYDASVFAFKFTFLKQLLEWNFLKLPWKYFEIGLDLLFRSVTHLPDIYLLQVTNGNTWTMSKICSRLAINTPEQHHRHFSSINYLQILNIVLVFPFLTLNKYMWVGNFLKVNSSTTTLQLNPFRYSQLGISWESYCGGRKEEHLVASQSFSS